MKRILLTVFVVLFIGCSVFASEGCANDEGFDTLENSVPTISVQGEGKLTAEADEALVYFGVKSDDRTLSKAYKANTEAMNAVISKVKSLNIDPKDIKTTSYNVTPVYPRDEEGRTLPGKPVSFKVSQQLTVKIRDIREVGTVIDSVIASGGNTFGGLSFTSSKSADLRKEAKILAAKDAREKALLLAESLGVSLGRVLRVGSSSPQMYKAPAMRSMAFAANSMEAAPQVESGEVEVNATCNVIYEIIQ